MDRHHPVATVLRLLAATGLGWLAWKLLYIGTHEASLVVWDCYGDGCSTDDIRAPAPIAGFFAAVATGVLASRLLRGATLGLVMILIAAAAGTGFSDAINDWYVSPGSVSGWITASWLVGSAGVILAVWGGAVSLVRGGVYYRWFTGRKTAVARLHRYEGIDQVRGNAMAVFLDHTGARYEVPVQVTHAQRHQPVEVFYDPTVPGDPARLRLGRALGSLSAEATKAINESLPVPADHHAATDDEAGGLEESGTDVVARLERLSRLHRAGDLSESEFAAAKRKLLG